MLVNDLECKVYCLTLCPTQHVFFPQAGVVLEWDYCTERQYKPFVNRRMCINCWFDYIIPNIAGLKNTQFSTCRRVQR